MSIPRTAKMMNYINYRMKINLDDGRSFVGKFMAFDRHMNLILGDAEEFRRVKVKGSAKAAGAMDRTEKRTLGLVLVRGEAVISMSVEGPPAANETRNARAAAAAAAAAAGPGQGRAAGRGLSMPAMQAAPPPGLGPGGRGAPMGQNPYMMPGQFPPGMPPPGFPAGRGGPPPGMMPPGMMPPGPPPPGMPNMPPPPFGRGMGFPPPGPPPGFPPPGGRGGPPPQF